MDNKVDFLRLLDTLSKGGYPFAIYRKARQSEIKILIQNDNTLHPADNYQSERGFVFAPFDPQSQDAVLLKPSAESTLEVTQVLASQEKFYKTTAAIPATPKEDSKAKTDFEALVGKALVEIKAGTLQKVVVSRQSAIEDISNDLPRIFCRMLTTYPDAMVYIFSHPKVGTWAGASPEILLNRAGEVIYSMSLAGTMPNKGKNSPAVWSEKEKQEQQYVTDFIRDTFERNLVEHIRTGKTTEQVAGSVIHLRNDVIGKMSDSTNINWLISQLAPTPAMCGVPREKAMDFIRKNEGYDRHFYAGFLGEVNLTSAHTLDLYVNIRCMQRVGKGALLYTGVGITALSNPQQEWNETLEKEKTLRSVII